MKRITIFVFIILLILTVYIYFTTYKTEFYTYEIGADWKCKSERIWYYENGGIDKIMNKLNIKEMSRRVYKSNHDLTNVELLLIDKIKSTCAKKGFIAMHTSGMSYQSGGYTFVVHCEHEMHEFLLDKLFNITNIKDIPQSKPTKIRNG